MTNLDRNSKTNKKNNGITTNQFIFLMLFLFLSIVIGIVINNAIF